MRLLGPREGRWLIKVTQQVRNSWTLSSIPRLNPLCLDQRRPILLHSAAAIESFKPLGTLCSSRTHYLGNTYGTSSVTWVNHLYPLDFLSFLPDKPWGSLGCTKLQRTKWATRSDSSLLCLVITGIILRRSYPGQGYESASTEQMQRP